jgi:hypothetical protein
MGAADSKIAFRKGVFRLYEEASIPCTDEELESFWSKFWTLPESAEDVFSLVGAQDVQRIRQDAPDNLRNLIHLVSVVSGME